MPSRPSASTSSACTPPCRLERDEGNAALTLQAPAPSPIGSYNLFTVSERDLGRLRELHLAYFRELRAIVAESEPAERVVVANVQLFGLDE